MNVILLNTEVSKDQLKRYADAVCFSQVGLKNSEISSRLDLAEHVVSAWIENWRELDAAVMGFHP